MKKYKSVAWPFEVLPLGNLMKTGAEKGVRHPPKTRKSAPNSLLHSSSAVFQFQGDRCLFPVFLIFCCFRRIMGDRCLLPVFLHFSGDFQPYFSEKNKNCDLSPPLAFQHKSEKIVVFLLPCWVPL